MEFQDFQEKYRRIYTPTIPEKNNIIAPPLINGLK